ncbi:FimV/HubP family polar landmark protein [Herminiimonas fonticola]|uniref:FimV/HubP family polar landmark protein n=1 Tax=Herminiimonas fonticola TaxID=303380 RepID=UPI00240DB80D|nr:FimV/HubP family polar landmark protein [Herminiimonas fonticola]
MLSNAHAAGLGKLTVLSSLGQPLRAEIELTSVAQDELGSLVPKLASADAFRQANIDLHPALFSLRFAVEQRGNRPIVRITSTQPINEPYVDMLLELGGNKNRLVREYTFLLDPPEMRSARPAQVAPITRPLAPVARPVESIPEPVAQSAPPPSQALPPPASSEALPPPAAEPAPRAAPQAIREATPAKPVRTASEPKADVSASDEYRVKKGDTLAKIANQHRPSGVSLDQMLVALYRANPDAFVGKNMNRLRAGQILSVPEADTAKSVGQSEARGVVVAQAADFNSYRNKLADQVATAEAKKSDDVKQTAGGKITTRIQEESAAAAESKDKLKLSKSGATTLSAGSDKAGASTEELIAKDKAIADANARVKELEKNVSELQKILEIKNKDLAEQQKQATAAATPAAVIPPVAAPAPVAETPSAATPPVAAEAPAAEPAPVPTAEPVVPPAPVAEVKPVPKKPVVVAPPPPEPSFLDDLMGNAMFLPGAAALLAGLGIYSSRRRKQTKSFEDSIISDSSLKSNSLFGSTGGQSVDTNNSVFNSNFVPSASQLDTNEVDPIAEADVYIAYGRDAQAEEILKEALRNQPDRHAVRVKLLEIYANRNDARSFEILASELYSMTKGEGEDWTQAANLGLILDPGNPLYASGAGSEKGESKAAALLAPTQPFDEVHAESPADVAESVSSFESSLAENSLSLPEEDEHKTVASMQPDVVEDLDFDLEGLDLETPDNKSPDATPAKAEMPADIADIDFGFLEDNKPAAHAIEEQSAPEEFSAPEIRIPDDLGLDFPSKSDAPVNVQAANIASTPIKDVAADLSDISLDLNPVAAPVAVSSLDEEHFALDGVDEATSYTSNAEMATKLDLAIAYQEIGDKEGARELLEEVVKGGNGEQSEKARNLLSKLA